MANKLSEIIADAYRKMAEIDTSTQYDYDVVKQKANDYHKAVCSGKVQRLFPAPGHNEIWSITAKRLPFLERKTPIEWNWPIKLTADANIWAVELSLDTTDLASSWAIYIKWCLIKYTNKTATTITGVTGVTISLSTGDIASPLFQISNMNLYKPFDLIYQVQDQERSVVFIEDGMFVPSSYYKVLNDWNDKYIYIVNLSSGLYWLKYIYEPDDMENDDDECLLEGNNGRDIISSLIAGDLLFDSEETQFAQEKLTFGYSFLISFYNKFNSDKSNQTKSIDYNFATEWDITRWYFNND